MHSPSFHLLTKTLLLIIFLGFGKTFAQEATITSETESILFSETESLVQLMLDNEPGEGLSEEQLVTVASSLLETDEPYIDLSSSDIPFNGGYAGAVLSNEDGRQVIISFNSHNENIEVTHNGYDTPTSVRAGHIVVRWVGVEARVDIQIFENQIGLTSLDAELEIKPIANNSFELLSIKALLSSEIFVSGPFPGNIIGSNETDTLTFEGANSNAWSVSAAPETQTNGVIISSISSVETISTTIQTGEEEYICNNPSNIGASNTLSASGRVINNSTPADTCTTGTFFLDASSDLLGSIEYNNTTFQVVQGPFRVIAIPNRSRGDRNSYSSSATTSSEDEEENSGGGSFSFLWLYLFALLKFLQRRSI